MRWPHYLLLTILGGCVALLLWETAALAELAGDFERRAVAAERAAGARRPAPEERPAQPSAGGSRRSAPAKGAEPDGAGPAGSLADYSRLQLELHTTREQLERLRELLAQRNEEIERRATAARERAEEALRPMPLGVRECLNALHECLRRDGFTAQRFLRASVIDADGLHDVELLEAAADGLSATFLTAARMTARLDRATGSLELRFFEGRRSDGGERAALPEEGFVVSFDDVDGRRFEERLPYLIRAEGAYPVPQVGPAVEPGKLDPGSRRQWAARLTRLLAAARTDLRWSTVRLRGLLEGRFLAVELVATNDKNSVLGSAHCARVAVEIDARRDVVSLLLQDGVMRREGVESQVDDQGFRMLLPGVTSKDATDVMLGMVVSR